jgi:hypothetical protein
MSTVSPEARERNNRFTIIDEALDAAATAQGAATRRLAHVAALRLIEQVMRLAADRVQTIPRAA